MFPLPLILAVEQLIFHCGGVKISICVENPLM